MTRLISVSVGLVLLVCGIYWALLLDSNRAQLAYAEEQTRLRAMQMAQAQATQVEILVSGIEYLIRSLAKEYQSNTDLQASIQTALDVFPPNSITQVGIADRNGQVVYSSFLPNTQNLPATTVADRAHFTIHTHGMPARLYIGQPVLGRISRNWTLPFSYPLERQGQFDGVIVASISPDYIADYFRKIFATSQDVALLLNQQGDYLARSQRQMEALDRSVPADREFLVHPEQTHGEYLIAAHLDGVERFYAWQRLENYPLLVSIGLGRAAALAETRQRIQVSIYRSLFGTLLLLSLTIGITWLFLRRARDQQMIQDSQERYQLALEGGNLGSWDWDITTDTLLFDARMCAMLGLTPTQARSSLGGIQQLTHPEDWPLVNQALQQHLHGKAPVFESEHRMRHSTGHWIWVNARGRITQQSSDHYPLRVTGTQADITEQVTATHLRHSLFDNSAAAIFLVQPDLAIRMANQRAVRTFTSQKKSLDGQSLRLIHVDDQAFATFSAVYETLRSKGQIQLEYQLRTASGQLRWFSIQGTLLDPEVPEGDVIWTMIDINDRRRAEDALMAARLRLTSVIENFPGGIITEDAQGNILLVNQPCNALLGLDPELDLSGMNQVQLRTLLDEQGLGHLPLGHENDKNNLRWPAEFTLPDERTLQINRVPVNRAGHSIGVLWILQDISEQRQHERTLERMATTDPLTGLANRGCFMNRLEQELALTATDSTTGALLMLDLDHFKQVNDTYGHSAGDAVLVQLADIFRSLLRKEDLAGRLGGEEFAVLLPGADLVQSLAIAERLRSTLEQKVLQYENSSIRVTASMGLTPLVPQQDAKTLLTLADTALYNAKRQGRNRVEIAQPPASEGSS